MRNLKEKYACELAIAEVWAIYTATQPQKRNLQDDEKEEMRAPTEAIAKYGTDSEKKYHALFLSDAAEYMEIGKPKNSETSQFYQELLSDFQKLCSTQTEEHEASSGYSFR